jgi:hypothetical protein
LPIFPAIFTPVNCTQLHPTVRTADALPQVLRFLLIMPTAEHRLYSSRPKALPHLKGTLCSATVAFYCSFCWRCTFCQP